MVKVAVFASGSGTNFENLVTCGLSHAEITLLIVDKSDAYALQRAEKLKIPHFFVDPKAYADKAAYETAIETILRHYSIDLIVLAGYMRYIGAVLLSDYSQRIINIHPAYLPNHPGAHGIHDSFVSGDLYGGVTVHYVDDGVDTGAIIRQEKVMIHPAWDEATFEKHIHALEYQLYPQVVDEICAKIEHKVG